MLLITILAGLLAIALAAIAAMIVGVIAAVLYWTPDRPLQELKARWAPPPSQFLDIGGMALHLRDEGPRDDPAPIVLLHGTSSSLHTWEGWAAALTARRRVIRYDMPGFGLTGPSPAGDYRIEAYALLLADLLDRLGVQRCVVAGNSFGGYVAWVFALLHPGRAERLILVDAAGYPQASTSVPLAFRIARMPLLGRLTGKLLPRAMVEASVRNVYGDPARVTPELVDRYYDLARRAGNRRALGERFRQAGPGVLSARVAELSLPTLILWGARDRLIPPESGARFNREIAGSRLVLFPELGHVPQEEDAARTVAEVQAFLGSFPG